MHLPTNGIISTNNLTNVPALLSTAGNVTNTYRGDVDMDSLTQKYCHKCGEWKDKSGFHKNKTRKDGLADQCKLCSRVGVMQWQANNPEKVKEKNKKYRQENYERELQRHREYYQDNQERLLDYAKQYRDNNKEKIRASQKQHRENNLGKRLENSRIWRLANPLKAWLSTRKWRLANPEKVREKNRNRRARLIGNGGTFTAQEWQDIKEYYDFTCLCCKRREPEIKLTPDHVIALKRGGTNSADNIQPLCRSCNSSKGAKHIDYRR